VITDKLGHFIILLWALSVFLFSFSSRSANMGHTGRLKFSLISRSNFNDRIRATMTNLETNYLPKIRNIVIIGPFRSSISYTCLVSTVLTLNANRLRGSFICCAVSTKCSKSNEIYCQVIRCSGCFLIFDT